jgi:hemolysin expression modulating protein
LKSPNAHSSLRETYLLKFRKCSTTETLDRVFERIPDKLNDEGGDINKITSLNGAYDHRRAEIYMKKKTMTKYLLPCGISSPMRYE